MFNSCKHKWVILDKTILDSAFEQLIKGGHKVTHADSIAMMCQKVSQTIVVCELCGQKDVHIVKLFEDV